ncbi:hypothetical protein B0H10DRAFT_1947928 [Mycena sp. CBHHK59/15]|nr:hypothetical protein B0H10DRAFT_1947928 [Mycena sp. CBHHK59/15]
MAEPKSTYKRPTTSSEDNPPRKRRKTMNSSVAANSSAMLSMLSAQFVDISDEQKSHTLRYMLHKFAADPSIVSAGALVTLACEHGLKCQKRPLLLSALESHLCTWACLVHSADAQEAGQLQLPNADVLRPVDRHLASHAHVPAERHKLSRKRASHRHIVSLEAERDESAIHWPQVESEESLKEIMREDRANTTAAILACSPCSFCNRNELVSELKTWDTSDLDISLLMVLRADRGDISAVHVDGASMALLYLHISNVVGARGAVEGVLRYAESGARAGDSRRWDVRRLGNGGSGATTVSYMVARALETAEVAGLLACQYLSFTKRRRKTPGKWSLPPGSVGALFVDTLTLLAWDIGRCEQALGDASDWYLWVSQRPGRRPLFEATPMPVATGRPVVRCRSKGTLPDGKGAFLVRNDKKESVHTFPASSPTSTRPMLTRNLRQCPILPVDAFSEKNQSDPYPAGTSGPSYYNKSTWNDEGRQLSFSNIARQDQLMRSPEFSVSAIAYSACPCPYSHTASPSMQCPPTA